MPNREELFELMGHDAYAELTGLEVIRAEPGSVEVRLPVTPRILNGHGKVHGGAMFTLADYASASVANLYGEPTAATNGSIEYLKAVSQGHMLAKAKTVKVGKRMKFTQVEIYDDSGDLCALFQGGAIVVSGRVPIFRPPA